MIKEASEADTSSQQEAEKQAEEKPKDQQQPTDDKMKQVLRQLFQDKQELKKLLENEINEHKADVKRIMEERDSIQAEYKKLAEALASKEFSSNDPNQQQKYDELKAQNTELTNQLRAMKLQLNDANLNQQVLQKQVDQYKLTVSTLEDDLNKADTDKYQLAVTKSRVSQLEDEVRQKSRQIKELETSARWTSHELQKLKGQLASAGARTQILGFEQGETVSVAPRNSLLPAIARAAYKEVEKKEPENESDVTYFVQDIPARIQTIMDERDSFNRQLQEYKRKFSQVKSKSINQISPEKMEETIKILLVKNEKKKEAIANLKNIAERQHAAITKLRAELARK